jgi:DNA-binding transcriptional regulator PaaX
VADKSTTTRRRPYKTWQKRAVLDVLLDEPGEWYCGDISHRTGLSEGTVNKILCRLLVGGWLYVRQGEVNRNYYRLTDHGKVAAVEAPETAP